MSHCLWNVETQFPSWNQASFGLLAVALMDDSIEKTEQEKREILDCLAAFVKWAQEHPRAAIFRDVTLEHLQRVYRQAEAYVAPSE